MTAAAVASAATSASVASCSYGNYDGTFDSAALDTGNGTSEAGAATVTRTIPPDQDTQVTSLDSAFDVTFLKGTFSAPTDITITQLADLTLGDGLIVPVYRVSAAGVTEPNLPLQVAFHGNANGKTVAPAHQLADGSYAFLPILGGGQNFTNKGSGPSSGPSATYWGITDKDTAFGVYSLKEAVSLPTTGFSEATGECMSCCAQNGGSFTAAAVEGSCVCAQPTDPNPTCFIGRCADPQAAAARCVALDNTAPNNLDCQPLFCKQPDVCCMGNPPMSAGCCQNNPGLPGCKNCTGSPPGCGGGMSNCPGQQPCCVDSTNPNQPDSCLQAGSACNANTFAVRCEHDGDCRDGRAKCCAVAGGTLCLPPEQCPVAQRVCSQDTECADAGPDLDAGIDGACQLNRYCPFGTCGPPPKGCR